MILKNEPMVSLVSGRYMRGENGTESLVVYLSEYLPLHRVYRMGTFCVHDSSVGVCFMNKVHVYRIGNIGILPPFPPFPPLGKKMSKLNIYNSKK